MRASEEGVCDEVASTAHGTAMLTPSLPLVWQVNAIRLEDPGATLRRAERRRPTRCRPRSGTGSTWCTTRRSARGWRPSFEHGGWNVFRVLIMLRRRAPERPPEPGAGARGEPRRGRGRARRVPARAAVRLAGRGRAPARGDGRPLRPGRGGARLRGAAGRPGLRVPAVRPRRPRRRWTRWARSRRAAAAATPAPRSPRRRTRPPPSGCEQVFMVTDAADWPQQLYRQPRLRRDRRHIRVPEDRAVASRP